MYKNYDEFIGKIKNKKILFCGVGRSNAPFIDMITHENIAVSVYDSKKEDDLDQDLIKHLRNNKFVSLRVHDESIWNEEYDIIIRTPGMNFLCEKLSTARENGAIVTSEMEIFFDICPCPIIGITGSDGKTTVSTLIYKMLTLQGITAHLGGNIGSPLLPKISQIHKNDIAVVELSSFQLISMRRSPDIAVITNISPNHLDVHKDMQEYIDAKKQIILHQNAFSKAVLNFDNFETKKMKDITRGKTLFFSISNKLKNGVWKDDDGNIIISRNGKDEKIMNVSEIKIPGCHNIENYLAAITAISDLVSFQNIIKIANSFNGVEHRIEFVDKINGVTYYNDSIASTPNRTIKGVLSLFDKKILLIAGGYDKNISFDEFASEITKKVSVLILLGNTSEKIENKVIESENYKKNNPKIIQVNSMNEAVEAAYNNSQPGDIVALSPACASFDLYKNFEDKGKHFKSLVKSLNKIHSLKN